MHAQSDDNHSMHHDDNHMSAAQSAICMLHVTLLCCIQRLTAVQVLPCGELYVNAGLQCSQRCQGCPRIDCNAADLIVVEVPV